jgi:hypothetical protein
MQHLIEFGDGSNTILIEAETSEQGEQALIAKVGAADNVVSITTKATANLEAAFDVVRHTATAFMKKVGEMAVKPATVEVEFGLKIIGEAGVFAISKVGGEANFHIKLKWAKEQVITNVPPNPSAKSVIEDDSDGSEA